ncbi:PREDICTED: phospholipase D gamma 1-like isoform X2 [Fragaria vesca subsp. vesca]|uniref:phospholipase D gamma 1-like isoform X2 n=1 Tax=Fragaria vesca subsp. vesca TaxID=101020 RepID=UPI0002C2F980|nr:PREDICTED: phospholipase D gamma 1-like isoform X2 [Fragaria vesca subsp. vesca]
MANSIYKESLSFGGPDHPQGQEVTPFESGTLKLLLHGSLVIWIKEAKNLPDMESFRKRVGHAIAKLPGTRRKNIISSPYVTISLSNAVIGRTFVMSNTENPVWEQHFDVPVAHYASQVNFVVKHSDVFGSKIIGFVGISAQQIYSGNKVEGTFPILDIASGKSCMPGIALSLSLSIQYTSIEKMAFYNRGVGLDPDHQGVPGTYFPLKKGGKVTLYQDAHVSDGCLPDFKLDGGLKYEHGSCWQDMFDAISHARHLIYIAGWSLHPKVRLLRNNNGSSDSTLGDLLKTKSDEGVKVMLLIWDDPTSLRGSKREGLMHTNDEDARRFFKDSSVQFLLCPRSSVQTWGKKMEAAIVYTHHQKTVIVDTDAGQSKRKIIAFVGGLDLCPGRYDTPEHSIFRTLHTVHKDDNHNPTFSEPVFGCPRQPWHDLHSKIDGPAAYDILINFEQRWGMASKPHGLHKLKERGLEKMKLRGRHKLERRGDDNDALLNIEKIPEIYGRKEVPLVSKDDKEAWDIQVFRSIDSHSVKGFPEDPKDAASMNLVCGKNVLIDMSIHAAYVKAIRAAQHFIYIENQYFLGSSYNWKSDISDTGANNLIPMEIALKIVNKIKANERFSAYIVIPMWPEGDPKSMPLQRILLWQHKTMQMMYEMIYKALKEVGLENKYCPQDYLNFFCLGNREKPGGEDTSASNNSSAAITPEVLTQNSRRFMIYVHSKGMIVDDEYVIVGSANINQRSMEGLRDTEIAIGAYQPHHTWSRKLSSPRGKIYGYRMSLWAEHLGLVEECFDRPESLECVQRVRSLGDQNWSQYAAEEVTEMKGHLLKYPVEVGPTGTVGSLPKCDTFPDIGGKILGSLGDLKLKSLSISSSGRSISLRGAIITT